MTGACIQFSRMLKTFFLGCFALAVTLVAGQAQAASCLSTVAGGNWNATTTWSGCGGTGLPVAGDDVTIQGPVTVNVATATLHNVTVNSGITLTQSSAMTISGTGTLSVAGTLNQSSTLTVNAGGVLSITSTGTLNSTNGMVIGGATNIAGALNITNTPGNHTFTGAVTVSSTGTWNNSGGEAVTFAGSITNNNTTAASFTAGIATQTFSATQTINGVGPVDFGGAGTLSTGVMVTNNNTNTITILGLLNGSNGGSTWVNGVNSTLNYGPAATGAPMATGVLTANATGNTVNYSRAGNQTIKLPSAGYWNLQLTGGSGTKTPPAGTLNILGDFTLGVGVTYGGGTNNPTVNLSGDFSNSGTFTSGSGVFTFNSSSTNQTVTGATTFSSLTINNTSGVAGNQGVTLVSNTTVTTLLTLTAGVVMTGANTLITSANCNVPSVMRTSGFVIGNLRKQIPAMAFTCTFEVGSGTSYTPVAMVFATAPTGAGSVTASTTGTEHLSIASSGIDASKSVNRFWTLTNNSLTLAAAGYNATFTYINGSPVDFDAGSTVANFIVELWNGTNWFPTTPSGVACSTTTCTISGQTAFGDFAIGEPLAGFNGNPGAFNVFETTTPAGAVLGRLFTKLVGTAPIVSVVAVINNTVNPAPSTAALTVDVIDASPIGGTLTATSNCRTTWVKVIQTQTVPAAVAWASGRVNVTITAPVNAVRNARIRVTQGANVGCSTDNFTIRPTAFTITTSAATGGIAASQTGTSGAPAIKTGANFNLTAASVAGYDGAPIIDNSLLPAPMVKGTPTTGTIGGSFGAAPIATGTATGNSFFYSEVGNFGLNDNAIHDDSFTGVDQANDCTPDFSNTLVGGKYGCKIGSTQVAFATGLGFGRFIPDNFLVNVMAPAPQFTTACATGAFTYVGQTFTYGVAPVMTVTARSGTNNGLTNATTTNYAGAYMKITNTTLTPNTTAARYSRLDALGGGTTPALDTSALPVAAGDPAIGTFANGAGTLTFGSGGGLQFTRSTTTPNIPFNADIGLALNVIDADSVAFGSNPANFLTSGIALASGNGIAFGVGNAGKEFRFGRLKLSNANGSQLLNLPVPMQAQDWNGTAFVTNALDSCTTLIPGNIKLTAPPAGVTVGSVNSANGGKFSSGLGSLILTKPSPAPTTKVAVNLCVDLGPDLGGGAACVATTPAALSYLQGLWAPGTSYQNDPAARATFGVYKGANEFIYLRENY